MFASQQGYLGLTGAVALVQQVPLKKYWRYPLFTLRVSLDPPLGAGFVGHGIAILKNCLFTELGV